MSQSSILVVNFRALDLWQLFGKLKMAAYQAIERDNVQVITCPAAIESADSAMEAEVKRWLLSRCDIHVLDFKETVEVRPAAYRAFVIFNQALKSYKKHLYCINLSQKLTNQFSSDGLGSVFISVSSLDEAKKRGTPPKAALDVEFINPFIDAAKNILEIQAKTKISAGKPFARKHDDPMPMEIAGVISLNSKEFTGNISLCFRAEVFLKIYEKLVGEKCTAITQEIEDGAAELLNMIFGQAKTTLNDEKGYKIERASPSVLTGEKLRLYHPSRNPSIVIPFDSPEGAFHIEILIDKS